MDRYFSHWPTFTSCNLLVRNNDTGKINFNRDQLILFIRVHRQHPTCLSLCARVAKPARFPNRSTCQWIILPLLLLPLAFARNESAENFMFGIDLCPRTSLPENFVSLHYFRTMRTRKTIRDKLRHVDNEENGRGTLADYIDSTLGWVMILKTFSNLNKYFWNATVSFFKKNIIYSCNDFYALFRILYLHSLFPSFELP